MQRLHNYQSRYLSLFLSDLPGMLRGSHVPRRRHEGARHAVPAWTAWRLTRQRVTIGMAHLRATRVHGSLVRRVVELRSVRRVWRGQRSEAMVIEVSSFPFGWRSDAAEQSCRHVACVPMTHL